MNEYDGHSNQQNQKEKITVVWTCDKKGEERLPLRDLHYNIVGNRTRGRQAKSWIDNIK